MPDYFKTLRRIDSDSAKYKAAKAVSHNQDCLAFSVADSDYESAPPIKQALNERVKHGAFGYGVFDEAVLNIIQAWYQRRYHCTIKSDWIMPAPKVLNALGMLIQTLTNKNDKILIQTPVYHVFKPVITNNKRRLIENPLVYQNNSYMIDFKDLEEKFKQGIKAFIFCTPHNPVGRVWTKQELKKIVDLCKQYDVYLLSDEIHADLIMPGHSFISCAEFFDLYDKIIVIHAPSKTFNIAGLQMAYIITPNQTIKTRVKEAYQAIMLGAPNILAVVALKAAYTKCDAWVDAQNRHIHNNYKHLKTFFNKHYPKAQILPLEGTYLTWVNLGFLKKTSIVIRKALEKKGMIIADGKKFGANPDIFIRINLACSSEQLSEGLKRFKKTFKGAFDETT